MPQGRGGVLMQEVSRSESARAGVSIGSQVRVIQPSPLEALTGTVTFINESNGLYEVRVDGRTLARPRADSGDARRD